MKITYNTLTKHFTIYHIELDANDNEKLKFSVAAYLDGNPFVYLENCFLFNGKVDLGNAAIEWLANDCVRWFFNSGLHVVFPTVDFGNRSMAISRIRVL
jgi:hypothetical protein